MILQMLIATKSIFEERFAKGDFQFLFIIKPTFEECFGKQTKKQKKKTKNKKSQPYGGNQ